MMNSFDRFILSGTILVVVSVMIAIALVTFGVISASESWVVFVATYIVIVIVAMSSIQNRVMDTGKNSKRGAIA